MTHVRLTREVQGAAMPRLSFPPGGPLAALLSGFLFLLVSPVWLGSDNPTIIAVPAFVAFAIIGLVLIGKGLQPAVARMRVGAPDVAISNTMLGVGEEFSVTYRQAWKRATDVNRILFRLVLRESVRYSRGTETVTETHDNVVQRFEIPGRHFEAGEAINDHVVLRIPETGMHTFLPSGDNRIQWFVQLSVEMAKWPDYVREYEVTVLPQMAR
jgi:hypothetical protein